MTSGLQSQDGVVGMKFASLVDGTHRVTELEPGGAAWSSGLIRIGDQILMVEGMRTSYVDKKRVEQAFRGRPGSFLTVEMQRDHKTFPVLLQRVERGERAARVLSAAPDVCVHQPGPDGGTARLGRNRGELLTRMES